ncbi:hypothetical protein BU14_0153s0042 [Porphyra umbilicalis]|uniref:Small EDRK-rich factor-like N-terminal domain-containing protein n=1 Tax=Porphyra umbilicalis TaxID=2786 RepID=A0A1X6P8S8_PORUM|nr:hypothetical protein BU14_0153s0042 [Porphyra umbilicalis]|eukprot:OSX77299.1 hypothetical protein BU14_0153s0042 [Porphyra umbilicalis]
MSRGNQREIDRQRAAKRAEKGGKNKKKEADGPNANQKLTNKKEKDAEIMRLKQQKAADKAAAAAAGGSSGGSSK